MFQSMYIPDLELISVTLLLNKLSYCSLLYSSILSYRVFKIQLPYLTKNLQSHLNKKYTSVSAQTTFQFKTSITKILYRKW